MVKKPDFQFVSKWVIAGSLAYIVGYLLKIADTLHGFLVFWGVGVSIPFPIVSVVLFTILFLLFLKVVEIVWMQFEKFVFYRKAKKGLPFSIGFTKEQLARELGSFADSLVLKLGYVPVPNILLDWKEMRRGAEIVQNIDEADSIKIYKEPFKGLILGVTEKLHGLEVSIIPSNYSTDQKEFKDLLKWFYSLRGDK